MPEVGECYSIAKKLQEHVGQIKEITTSKKFSKYILKGKNKPSLLANSKILKIKPYGKSIWFYGETKSEKFIITSQLGMTGSWFINDAMEKRGHVHLRILINKTWLNYSDPRMFGKMYIYTGKSFDQMEPEIIKKHKWGIDPIISSESEILFQLLKLGKSNQVIKVKLLEQNLIFGIGNYLASEILYDAKISPNKKCSNLNKNEFQSIAKSMKKWVMLAKENNGFSFAGGYIMPDGSWGNLAKYIKVYQKEDQPCEVCKNKITKSFISGRATFYCKKCQKDPVYKNT